jgi:hypothetical protein
VVKRLTIDFPNLEAELKRDDWRGEYPKLINWRIEYPKLINWRMEYPKLINWRIE